MTITIPVWLMWLIGIPAALILLVLAWVGFMIVKDL